MSPLWPTAQGSLVWSRNNLREREIDILWVTFIQSKEAIIFHEFYFREFILATTIVKIPIVNQKSTLATKWPYLDVTKIMSVRSKKVPRVNFIKKFDRRLLGWPNLDHVINNGFCGASHWRKTLKCNTAITLWYFITFLGITCSWKISWFLLEMKNYLILLFWHTLIRLSTVICE